MAPLLGKLMLFSGLAGIVLTGYQAMTYRENVRLLQQEFTGLPLPLLLQLLLTAAISLAGSLQVSGSFRPIRIADNPKPVVLRPHRLEFASFQKVQAAGTQLKDIPPVPPIS